jgi:formate hydrogenlyase subunit 3/multisubunit Na+/H+ antiporter MnhD subunit
LDVLALIINQPVPLFAYSTINEIGLMLMAIETAGFHSLFQHLSIYIVSIHSEQQHNYLSCIVSFSRVATFSGFFGKVLIFNSVATGAIGITFIYEFY